MLSVGNDRLECSSSSLEDILVKKILLTHDPDGRRIDSERLLHMMENIMCYATTSNASESHLDAHVVDNIEVVGSNEPLGQTIYQISYEIQCKCSGERDLDMKTMALFDLVGNFTWDAKMVLVLAAFATSYGEFWLLMQLYPINPLAVSVAMLKQLPNNLGDLQPRFKVLRLLVKTMVDVTKCIIEFEGLPVQHVKLDDKAMTTTKSQIYIAAYWVTRSAMTCSSQIKDLAAVKHEYSNLMAIARWELSSLLYRMSSILSSLRRQLDACHIQIEAKLHEKLLELFKEAHVDNQEVLHTLFSLKDKSPLKNGSSQAKLGVSELANKEVILLISKPEILPLEEVLLLVQQTHNYPCQNALERSYAIIWVPISSSSTWTEVEEKRFCYLSNTLPWYSIHQPWLLSSVVVSYIKQEWSFEKEPLMVVLDPHGRVTSTNAIDMVMIWGAMAYPFSIAREVELWEEATWTLQLLMDELDPLLSLWVEERRTVCLYGGDDLEWVREFNNLIKGITNAGVQLEVVYVGKKNLTENVRNILATIDKEKLSGYLSYPKIHYFWLRLESMRRSKLRLGKTAEADHILEEVISLLNMGTGEKGWAVMGEGLLTDIIKLQGRKLMECFSLFQLWGENVIKVGFLGSIRAALEPLLLVEPCCRSSVVPYIEGSTEETVFCEECKHPMEKHILYQCCVPEKETHEENGIAEVR